MNTALDAASLEQLAAGFSGEVIGSDGAAYDEARTVYNAMIDRRPAVIARCASTADVVAAVNFAREEGLVPAVRICDDGILIDLTDESGEHAAAECVLGAAVPPSPPTAPRRRRLRQLPCFR